MTQRLPEAEDQSCRFYRFFSIGFVFFLRTAQVCTVYYTILNVKFLSFEKS